MRKNYNRVKQLEAAFAGRAAQGENGRESAFASEGWAYRSEDVCRLTTHWKEGRNKEYLSGEVSLAELARRAGVEPCGKSTGEELTDEDCREMLLEEEECEAKGWTCNFVDGDVNKRLAWFAWVDGKFTLVSELRMFEGWMPEQIEEFERRQQPRR